MSMQYSRLACWVLGSQHFHPYLHSFVWVVQVYIWITHNTVSPMRLCAQLFGRLSWWYESPLATRSKSLSNSIKQHDIQNSNIQEVKTTVPVSAAYWCFRSLWKGCCRLFGLNWKVKQSDQLYLSNLDIYNIFSPLIPHSIHLQIHQITLLKMALDQNTNRDNCHFMNIGAPVHTALQ